MDNSLSLILIVVVFALLYGLFWMAVAHVSKPKPIAIEKSPIEEEE